MPHRAKSIENCPHIEKPNYSNGMCRSCYNKDYRKKNPDFWAKKLAKAKAYRAAHKKERVKKPPFNKLEYNRKWRERNREYYQASCQTKEFKEKQKGYRAKRNRTPEGRFSMLKFHAKRQKRTFTLTFEEWWSLVEANTCFYCNGVLEAAGGGLDRIDSSRGYETGNVRPCCKRCNGAKSDMPEFEFKQWIKKVWETFVQKEMEKRCLTTV